MRRGDLIEGDMTQSQCSKRSTHRPGRASGPAVTKEFGPAVARERGTVIFHSTHALNQRGRRDETVRVVKEFVQLVDGDFGVESNPDPTSMANVGRDEERFAVALKTVLTKVDVARAPKVRKRVFVMTVGPDCYETLLLSYEERWCTVTEPFAHLRECETVSLNLTNERIGGCWHSSIVAASQSPVLTFPWRFCRPSLPKCMKLRLA